MPARMPMPDLARPGGSCVVCRREIDRRARRCRSCAQAGKRRPHLTPEHQRAAARTRSDREQENARLAALAREHGLG